MSDKPLEQPESEEDKAKRMPLDRRAGVYTIKNTATGKYYVGSSRELGTRLSKHKSDLRAERHHSQKLQRAWRKHGADAFEFKVILVCAPDNLLMYEQIFIDALHAASDGYNVMPVAGSAAGYSISAEARARLSLSKKGHKHSEEFREMRRLIQTGKTRSEETKAKISAAMTGRRLSESTVQKLRGRTWSEESRAKLSDAVRRMHARMGHTVKSIEAD